MSDELYEVNEPTTDQIREVRLALRKYLQHHPTEDAPYDMPEHILAPFSVTGLLVILVHYVRNAERQMAIGEEFPSRHENAVAAEVQVEIENRFLADADDAAETIIKWATDVDGVASGDAG